MSDCAAPEQGWRIVFQTGRVYKGWQDLFEKAKENMEHCRNHLSSHPLQRIPGRVFPLKGNAYKGTWEYEVTSGDRVFYRPKPETKTVVIYYAGKHPKPPSPLHPP